jgi:hypothetical protein
VAAAHAIGGVAGAGIWVQGWPSPVLAGAAGRVDRMWSMSKPVVAVALLTKLESLHESPSKNDTTAMLWALTASDDCAMRYLELQLQNDGRQFAIDRFRQVLVDAGIDRSATQIAAAPGSGCFSSEPWGAIPASELSLEFGTYRWNVADAVHFAHSLIDGRYGEAGHLVAEGMRRPKQHPYRARPSDYTSPLDEPPMGGNVFPRAWYPGYKGGWGGANHDDFLAGQIVILDIHGIRIGLAAYFWPKVEPPTDNPGATKAPAALESLFGDVADALKRLAAKS